MPSTRREILKRAAAAGTVSLAALEPLTSAAAASSIPMIDTHQHLWDGESLRIAWLKDPGAAKVAGRHNMADYLREAKGLGIVKTIYMEVDADEDQQMREAQFVISTCKGGKTPMRKGVVSGRPNSPGFLKYAAALKDSEYIKGFRQILHPPNRPRGLCLQPQFVKSIQQLGEWGKSYDICIRPGELADGYKLADLCPNTSFILDHCGNGEANWGGKGPEFQAWKDGISEFALRMNVSCKLSGVIKTCKDTPNKAAQLRPLVDHVIDAFGPDRVIWASDWPVCEFTASLKEWVDVAHALTSDLPSADRKKIFHDNAVKFYRV